MYVIVSLIHGVNVPVRAVIAVGVGTPYLNVVENAVPANPHELTPATDKVPPTNVASYLILICELSALLNKTVVPTGRTHLNLAGAT